MPKQQADRAQNDNVCLVVAESGDGGQKGMGERLARRKGAEPSSFPAQRQTRDFQRADDGDMKKSRPKSCEDVKMTED